ncbi:hypothetical protein [Lysinibacillus fusiformis]|uniref:hypothetical protein n=1 Tax=Lysinibacillus fusiformis TaxID=28031 RepID=UPI003D026008
MLKISWFPAILHSQKIGIAWNQIPLLRELSVKLDVNPRQIILGKNEVALNIDSSKDENIFAEILHVTYIIQKSMRWSGSLSYIMVPKNFQSIDYFG